MATAVSASAPTRSGKTGASSLPVRSSPRVPDDPDRRLLESALPTDPASIPVHAADEDPAVVADPPRPAHDPLEAEADAAADHAESREPAVGPAPNYRRYEDDNPIPASAPPRVRDALRSPSLPLDATTRTLMERRFGRDFANVRIHSGPLAQASAAALNARAYTTGSHIVLGPGAPPLDSLEGRRLLAHELTHVTRQAQGIARGRIQAKPDKPAKSRIRKVRVEVDHEMGPDELLRLFVRTYYNLKSEDQIQKKLHIWHWANGKGRSVTAEDVKRHYTIVTALDYAETQMANMSEEQRKEINKEADERFWAETGYKPGQKLGNSPKDKEMAKEWLSVRDDIVHEEEQLRAINALDDSIKKILFAGDRKIGPDDYDAILKLAEKLSKLTPAQRYDYLSKVNADTDSYADMDASIDRYIQSQAAQEKEEEATDAAAQKLFGMEELYKLYRAKQKAVSEYSFAVLRGGYNPQQLQATQEAEEKFNLALKQNNFSSEQEFESALEAYRLRFRAEAVHLAMEILARYENKLFLARKRFQNQANAATLVQNIGATQAKQHYKEASEKSTAAMLTRMSADPEDYLGTMEAGAEASQLEQQSEQLKSQAESEVVKASGNDPLIDPAQLGRGTDREKLANLDAAGAQQYLLQVIQERENDLARARGEFDQDPDRIFSLPGLVEATKHVLNIGDETVYSWIVRDYIQEEHDKHVFTAVVMGILALILGALTFGGGWIAAAALVTSAVISTEQAIEAVQEYNRGETEYRLGFIEDEPSMFWVGVAIAGAALDMGMAASAVFKAAAPALKELEAPLRAFSEASDAETAAKRLEDLRSKLAQVQNLDARVKAAIDAKAAAELGLKEAIGKLGQLGMFGGDPIPAFEAMYYSIKKGVNTVTKLRGDAEMIKIMGDVTKMKGAAREELTAAFEQVKKIVSIGEKGGMSDELVLRYVDRLAAERAAGPGAFEVITDEMKAWRPQTAEQIKAAKGLTEATDLLSSLRQQREEMLAELKAGPKLADGTPDTARIQELRKELAELEDKIGIDSAGKRYVQREGLISKAERKVTEAEKIAEQAAVDPKEVMRRTFGSSTERANTIAGATEDQVGKIGGGAGLKTKPSGLTVEHIVSIDEITGMEGFDKLTRSERKALAVRQDNLIVMDSSANSSKGPRSWANWKQSSTFYDDATKQAMLAKEAELRAQIKDWIRNQVKGR